MATDSPTHIVTSGMMVQESGSGSSERIKNESTIGGFTHAQSNVQLNLQNQIDSDNAKKIEQRLLNMKE